MTRNTKIVIGVTVAVALFVGAYFGSPLLALRNLSQAAKAGDRDRLELAVDFPAVRTSLKAQLSAALIKSMSADPDMKDNPFAGLGLLLAPAIIDRAIETYVTPDAIATIITTAKTPASPTTPAPGPVPTTPAARKLDTQYSFSGMNRFRAYVHDPDAPPSAGKLGLIFERRGLFTWKLIRIDVPLDPVAPATAAAVPAAEPEPVNSDAAPLPEIGACQSTRVSSTSSRLDGDPDSGSVIAYANGLQQVSYNQVPGIVHSQVGDDVELCVTGLPKNCPPGDNRGVVYHAQNARTGESWTEADSSHMCGGA